MEVGVRGENRLKVRSKDVHALRVPYLVSSHRDVMNLLKKCGKKMRKKNSKYYDHLIGIYPYIPVILRVRVAVCCSVPKTRTIPEPALPVLEAPRVYPYPCSTLVAAFNQYHVWYLVGAWSLVRAE